MRIGGFMSAYQQIVFGGPAARTICFKCDGKNRSGYSLLVITNIVVIE